MCIKTVPNRDARRKAAVQRTAEGAPLPSCRTPRADWATIAQHRVQPQLGQAQPCDLLTRPAPLQRQALDLLGLRLERIQCRSSSNGR